MPTVLRLGSLMFFFTSYDCSEPIHIHIVDGNKECKYWLRENNTVVLADNKGFRKNELLKLRNIVIENYQLITTTWNEQCKDTIQKQYKKKHSKR